MDTKGAFSVEYAVHGFDCGYGGPFSPFSLANYFQEAAGLDADRLGFGMADLAAAGRTWMLSRIVMRIDGLPREGDRVRARTWPSGCERLFALRDLVLEDEAGGMLVRAVYAYLVVDVASRKPLRPDRALDGSRLGSPEHALADFEIGAASPPELEPVYELRARARHIDHNGHVNNAHYVHWLVDAAAGRAHGALRELKVDFLREVLENERLEARFGELPGGRVGTELRRGGEVVARAELSFAS
jgi:medium-chain acyl-[acyl-carrier-protein] hydrolase